MGYYSSMTGSITVTPVPPASKLDLSGLMPTTHMEWAMECINPEFEKETSTTVEPDGTEVTRTKAISVVLNSCDAGEHKHYYVAEGLQAIVNHFGVDRNYQGYFHFKGEDADQWRIAVVNGMVKEFRPEMIWPEEVR